MNVSSATASVTPQMVPAAARKAADNDGDGKTGAAALNDGDAAAQAARRAATPPSGRVVDVHA
jgi:hypothetical protein